DARHHLARLAHGRQRGRDRRPGPADRGEGVLDPLPRRGEGQPPHLDRRRTRHPGRDLRRALLARPRPAPGPAGHLRARGGLYRDRRPFRGGRGPSRRGRGVALLRDHGRRHRPALLRVGRPGAAASSVAMVFINYAARELNCKIVYYGPGLCGKTTNLRYIYERTNPDAKGKMISLATETDRTLFF